MNSPSKQISLFVLDNEQTQVSVCEICELVDLEVCYEMSLETDAMYRMMNCSSLARPFAGGHDSGPAT